jgi:hypothetical protein
MSASGNLKKLIDSVAPYFGGEAEVVRTYFASPGRSIDSDLKWLAGQCYKEFGSGGVSDYDRGGVFVGGMRKLLDKAFAIDTEIDRREILGVLEGITAEFSHYIAFADIYDEIRPAGMPKMHTAMLRSWPEEDTLANMRHSHREKHGVVGARASKFTEGGYVTLFSEGMKLKSKSSVDDKIASACAKVYEDEFGHMLNGIIGIAEEGLSDKDYTTMADLAIEQMKARIHMRNAQFSHPVKGERLQALLDGKAKPIEFDYAKAKIAA